MGPPDQASETARSFSEKKTCMIIDITYSGHERINVKIEKTKQLLRFKVDTRRSWSMKRVTVTPMIRGVPGRFSPQLATWL